MNFEQLLSAAIHHRRTKDKRKHGMAIERDAVRSGHQARLNAQRFGNQQQLQQRSQQHQLMRDQQQQHFQEQQRIETEQREAAQIDADITAIKEKRANNEISEEQERTLLWKLENKKRGLMAAGGPPPDTPKYVGTDQDIGDVWWDDTTDPKPGGGFWRVQYTRTNRGDVQPIRDERKEWEEREKTRREQDREDAAERRSQATDERKRAAEERLITNEDRAEDRADRDEDRADREEKSANRAQLSSERSQEAHDSAQQAKTDTALYTRLERRAERSADAELADDWDTLRKSKEYINAATKAKERMANEGGFDVDGTPTDSKRKQKVNQLLQEYLDDPKNEAGHLSSAEPQMPFNDQTGMYEVVV